MNLVREEDSSDFGSLNETGNENLTEYLEDWSQDSKSYRDPLYVVIPITVVYVAIFLTGIVGNISTCIVIARNKHMHTATNYYLFSLAISDLLLLVSGLPPEVFFMWRKHSYVFGETFCVLQSFAAETSANATVLTITAFTIERYVAICHPFQSHTLSKLSRAVKFVIAIWISALGLAVPQAIQYGVVTVMGALGSASTESYCTLKKVLIPNAFLISICVFFVVPMTLISVLYILIGLKLRKSRLVTVKRPSPNKGDVSRHRTATSQTHVIRMLVAVVVGFFICWAPFHAQRLVAMYGHLDEHPSRTVYIVYIFLTYISGVLYYLSTTINPLLYHIMSHKFRNAFKSTLVQICSRKKRKSGKKQKLYVTLPRPNNRSSFHNQNLVSLVSFHNVKIPAGNRTASNGNLNEVSLPPTEKKLRETEFIAESAGGPDSGLYYREEEKVGEKNDMKIINLRGLEKEREMGTKCSRDSFSCSQITLMTSYSKIEDEGNNNVNHCPNHSPDLGNKVGGGCGKRRDEPDSKDRDYEKADENNKMSKTKCTCWNCEKKKRGITSLTNKCMFKAKSQTATLETIAKKIRLLPTKNKRSKESNNKVNQQTNKKFKLIKTYSSYTISNSSLQDLDESEFTSSELANIMGQIKHEQEVQV